jgi:putative membrane protein
VKEHLIIYLKGIAMGAADVVPGVSGGTIAFISGIYERLLTSIRHVDGRAIKLLFGFKIKELWEYVNGWFMLALLSGIGTSILALSKLILYLLDNHSEMVWSFFFGLVVASALVVGRKIHRWNAGVIVSGLVGTAIAYWVTVAVPVETPTELWFIFLSGAIAICAMILPGISGSFILLLMGKYEYIFKALTTLDFKVIFTFMLGCLTGILSFSHVLNWLLKRYHDVAVSLLMGFMVGSLNKVWPWKQVLQTYTDRHGEVKPLLEGNVLPTNYLALAGKEPYLLYCVVLCILGFGLVYGLERLSDRKTDEI